VTNILKSGDQVIASRTVLKPEHVRNNGEVIPERLKTTIREGRLLHRAKGGWIVEWRGASRRSYTEHFFDHEITKVGTNPLLLEASDK